LSILGSFQCIFIDKDDDDDDLSPQFLANITKSSSLNTRFNGQTSLNASAAGAPPQTHSEKWQLPRFPKP